MRRLAAALCAALALSVQPAAAGLINGGFEAPAFTGTGFKLVNQSGVPGWRTTASDGVMEFWHGGFNSVVSREGRQHVELNANLVSTLFQDIQGLGAGSLASFRFAHRGRNGVDTIRLTITDLGSDGVPGGGNDTQLFLQTYATGASAWNVYSGGGIALPGNTVRFAFESVSAAGGNRSIGNFLDDVAFSAVPVPEPGTLALLALPMLGLLASRRRRAGSLSASAPLRPR